MRIGKNIFICLMAVAMLLASSTASEAMSKIANSDFILADLHAHPNSYIRFGGHSIGCSYYMSKSSIAIQKYEPPTYILTVQTYDHMNVITPELPEGRIEYISHAKVLRFKYDYDTRKIYVEETDRNGAKHWEYIDPKRMNDNDYSYHRGMWAKLVAGEMCFYLAYNMSFFDKPYSHELKEALGLE